jgi:hypothetical protein
MFEGQLADNVRFFLSSQLSSLRSVASVSPSQTHLNLVRLAPISFSANDNEYSHNQAEINKAGIIQIQYHRITNLRWAEPVYPVPLEGVVLEEKPETDKPLDRPTHQA